MRGIPGAMPCEPSWADLSAVLPLYSLQRLLQPERAVVLHSPSWTSISLPTAT